MIVKALVDYYNRALARNDSRVIPFGMEAKEIKFVIVVDEDGKLVNFEDVRIDKKRGKTYLVPRTAPGRTGSTGYKVANLLWDHCGYVLGANCSKKKNNPRQLKSFIETIKALPEHLKKEKEIAAVIKFYDSDTGIKDVLSHSNWKKCYNETNCPISFKLAGSKTIVTENAELKKWIISEGDKIPVTKEERKGKVFGRCMVTGEVAEIKRLHEKIGGFGKNSANLIGCQTNRGYDSYGATQAYNSPTSVKAEFAYVTALKTLLKSDRNHLRIDKTTLLFWAAPKHMSYDKAVEVEDKFKRLFSGSGKDDDPNLGVDSIKAMFKSIATGKMPTDVGDKFYILGLTPNESRLRTVMWVEGTIKDLAKNITRFFDDVDIVGKDDKRNITLGDILSSSVYKGDVSKIPPKLISSMVGSVFNGSKYPTELMQYTLERVRAERYPSQARVAFLKAYLNRNNKKGEKITMKLDRNNNNVAYRIGRLFAVMEMAQGSAIRGVNAGIRDKYYGTMSTTPGLVLSEVLKMSEHHLSKLNKGKRIYLSKEMDEIFSGLNPEGIPKNFSKLEQLNFAIGYHHEREALFTGTKEEDASAYDSVRTIDSAVDCY